MGDEIPFLDRGTLKSYWTHVLPSDKVRAEGEQREFRDALVLRAGTRKNPWEPYKSGSAVLSLTCTRCHLLTPS